MSSPDDRRIDYLAVHDALRAGRATPAWLEGWLPATWNDPERWRSGLYASVRERRGGSVKGQPGGGFDLYHDCVLAHVGRRRAALVAYEDGEAAQVTFEALHDRVSALARAWLAAGVAPGDCVAIVLPVGFDYVAALATALRLGLIVAPLPPLGPTYVRSRVARLAPDHVVSIGRHSRTLAPGTVILPVAAGADDESPASSHVYTDEEPVLRLLSPFGAVDADPVELSADVVHEALLRDAMLVFALEAGDRMAAPGLDPLQLQPLTLLTAWIAGATWVEFEPRDLEAEPKMAVKAGVTVLGVSRRVRDLLLRHGGEGVAPGTSWFRMLNDVYDHDLWAHLSRTLGARKASGFSVLANAASGGAHLFAPRGLELHPMQTWPAPGRHFQMSQVGAGLLPSLTDAGTYTPLLGKEADASLLEVVLARQSEGFTLGGSVALGPQGRTVPGREIASAAERHPAVRAAAVVVAPGRWIHDAHAVLLLFVEADLASGAPEPVPLPEVDALVRREMGDCHAPTRIETYGVRPRFACGAVDDAWCRSQYLSGALALKARLPLFAASARIGWIFGASPPGP
jgi:hypothetical protein